MSWVHMCVHGLKCVGIRLHVYRCLMTAFFVYVWVKLCAHLPGWRWACCTACPHGGSSAMLTYSNETAGHAPCDPWHDAHLVMAYLFMRL